MPTFLEQASQKGHGEIVEVLISSGASATSTALVLALQNNHKDIADNLRSNGVEDPSLSPPQKISSTSATKINFQPRFHS